VLVAYQRAGAVGGQILGGLAVVGVPDDVHVRRLLAEALRHADHAEQHRPTTTRAANSHT
jgi:hypothetical protein